MFPPFRIPNPFSSFPSFLWEKCLAVGIAKASDTLCEHLGNLTVKCWVQQPSSWLNPLHCDCWVISVLGDQYQVKICRSIIMEAFAHPFCHFIEFREGLEEVQNKHCNRSLSGLCHIQLWFCPQPWGSGGSKRTVCQSSAVLLFFPHAAVGLVLMLA